MVAVKAEETISTEATIQEGEIFKEEATIKTKDIIKVEDKVQVEEKLKIEDKIEDEDSIKEEDSLKAEAAILVKLFAGDVTKLDIMLRIVELPLIKFLGFIKTLHSLQMIKTIMMVQKMSSQTPNKQLYRFQPFLEVNMKMHGFWIQEQLNT